MAPHPGSTGLDGFVRSYLDHLTVERGVSTHTASAYRRDLRRYAAFLAGQGVTELDRITPELVSGFVRRLRDDGLASASVARAVVAVRSLHRFAVEEHLIPTSPAADVVPPGPGRRLPKALSLSQVQALLGAPDLSTPLGLRDAALLELLYGTGARISEIVTLDVDDLTPLLRTDGGAGLRLLGKGDKERIVPLGSYACAAVDAWLVRGRPALATSSSRATPALLLNQRGGRLSRQSAWAVLQQHAAGAGIEVDVSPHTLRHTYATHLLDGGADVRVVQELLGHASVTTTQIYTLVTVEHLREVYLTAHPRAY